MLAGRGYSLLGTTATGEDGLDRAGKLAPDLVLVDLSLAGQPDGRATGERIRLGLDLPVLWITPGDGDVSWDQEANAEPFEHVAASCSESELHARIRMALCHHELQQALKTSVERCHAAEDTLRRHDRDLNLLNKANQALGATLDQEQVLAIFLEEVGRLLGVEALSVWLIDPATRELLCEQAVGPLGDLVRGFRLAPGKGIAGRVAASGVSLLVEDTRTDDRHFKGVDEQTGMEIRSILSVPLKVKGETIGALQIVDEMPQRFQATDLMLLESLAATAAIAIEHARLYHQAREDAETKSRLLREVNHRVKNNLSAIIGILYAEQQHTGTAGQGDYRSVMQRVVGRVQGLAAVHTLLSSSHWAPLELGQLGTQVGRSALQALPPDKRVAVDIAPSSIFVTADQAHYLALVINEFVTNTVKHALHGRSHACITMRSWMTDGLVCVEFRDDGPGYPTAVQSLTRHGVGFDLVQSIVQDGLRGDLRLYNDAGAVALIRFRSQVEST
jgi:two-component sensor histidine kinase/DNA-binding response OmpR family regulator